jgi:hypothetical protein
MAIEIIVDAIIDIINKNMIAKTNVTANVTSGDVLVHVDNTFQFSDNQEIVLIDYGYNVEGSTHYQVFEYAKILEVNNTTTITLTSPVEGNWLVSDKSFIQKTIGHAPLLEGNVFYGDREVIPFDQMAVAVEPSSLTNEWIYIQGGLSEEYRVKVLIYGRDIKFEEGRRILDRYSDAIYQLLLNNIHLELKNYHTPLTVDYVSGSTTVYIANNADNVANIVMSDKWGPVQYKLQDNQGVSCWFYITNIATSGGNLVLTISNPIGDGFLMSEFAFLDKWDNIEYIYNSKVDTVTYGVASKGTAYVRASELNWWGKKVNEHRFPQRSNRV